MASLASPPPPNRPLDGMEVPIPGSDKVRWIELTVPSSPRAASPQESSPATSSRNAAACHVLPGDDLARIHKDLPNAVEMIEICPQREFPESGLRLIFPESLFPFAFVCRDENASGTRCLLYALTESGTAYLFKLGSLSSYISGSVISQSDFIEFVVERDPKITAAAATFGCLLVGRQDGSVTSYKLGILEQSAPGFMTEFRDDVGMGRLWSLVSRGRTVAMVKDLLISQVCGRKLIFALHLDGTLRVWDLMNHTKVLNHNTIVQELTGSTPSRVWVGDPNYDTSVIPLAVLYGYATWLMVDSQADSG
ncbi:hypothetical protein Taro_025019 [Colocasia esculenta]|uniref:Nucleoporin Nup120/160 beta-propeller domain-containing protein n=1 Tax=Colocasia esculenta TaxID=4460 RepID=A0A843VM46_COLES|nr:hypothetical protein [Colocasia esculenta]